MKKFSDLLKAKDAWKVSEMSDVSRNKKTRNVVLRVPVDLREKVWRELQKTGHGWHDLLIPAMRLFLKERGSK